MGEVLLPTTSAASDRERELSTEFGTIEALEPIRLLRGA